MRSMDLRMSCKELVRTVKMEVIHFKEAILSKLVMLRGITKKCMGNRNQAHS